MERRIVVYTHGDSRPKQGFPTHRDLKRYVAEEIFTTNGRRYCHTQGKRTDVVVLTHGGLAYGRFDVEDCVERPTRDDRERLYDRVRFVYCVRASFSYGTPVRLSNLDIRGLQFGKFITEAQLAEIERLAGSVRENFEPCTR